MGHSPLARCVGSLLCNSLTNSREQAAKALGSSWAACCCLAGEWSWQDFLLSSATWPIRAEVRHGAERALGGRGCEEDPWQHIKANSPVYGFGPLQLSCQVASITERMTSQQESQPLHEFLLAPYFFSTAISDIFNSYTKEPQEIHSSHKYSSLDTLAFESTLGSVCFMVSLQSLDSLLLGKNIS